MKSTFLSFLGVAMTMATMAWATNVRDTRGSISVRHGGSKRSGISSEDLEQMGDQMACLLYTSPSPRDRQKSRMPSSA